MDTKNPSMPAEGGDSIDKIFARVHASVDAWIHARVCAPDSLSGHPDSIGQKVHA